MISQSSSEIELQLTFEQPLYVSFEKEPDKLVIDFFYEEVFISANGIKIKPQNKILTRNLIRQLPLGAVSPQAALSSFGTFLQSAVASLFAANLLLNFGLKEIFSMIEVL